MATPESTSANGLIRFIGGTCLKEGHGEAWKENKAWIIDLPRRVDAIRLPAVSEPFLAMTVSGAAAFEEREQGGEWVPSRIGKNSLFLTSGGAPYDCRWTAMDDAPFQALAVFIAIPILRQAFEEVFGGDAEHAVLLEGSAFRDPALESLLSFLHAELLKAEASPLLVQGIAQAIAVHLARNHSGVSGAFRSESPSLPGFKLRQVLDWMAENLSEDLNLDRISARAGLSKYHFHRLFKKATGLTPSGYHLDLRLNAAQRLLRETGLSIIEIGMEVGFANPSHFAKRFRKETGLSPSEYRRQR